MPPMLRAAAARVDAAGPDGGAGRANGGMAA
ncbi:hypothetical protein J2X16_003640 [Pelomonas aquatica]|uniref:Uncharacterized protein n=1 Tax=Pelomonas aquatica TaxID=431058 RepID=A0ABU1ZCC6_9BURK|nr:hypothetical protein [Pelomonas aquatica]